MVTDEKNVPRGRIARGAVVGSTAVKVGAKKAVHAGKRPFLSRERRRQADLESDEAIARMIFDALCLLRGTALKAAQVLAMEIEFLPEVYRNELAKSASEVPPMNRALLGKVLRRELEAPPQKVFRSFEPVPFAAASLGQVHAAEDADGRPLAVKVQYPGMADGVKTDLDLLKGVLAPTRFHRIFAKCFPEIRRKVHEELDYLNEAQNTRYFADAFNGERFCVPDVYDAYSTAQVICTSRIRGDHLDAWLAGHPSQERRDHFGQRLVDFFHTAMFEHHLIHADPNPGNYLFRDDGRLGVIDFGCCSRLRPAFVDAIAKLLGEDASLSVTVAEALHATIGIHYRYGDHVGAFADFLETWLSWLKAPYQRGGFDFRSNYDYFERGLQFRKDFMKYIDYYDSDFVYYGRTLHGLMRILQRLGARVKMAPPF
jgi:predicted unusual protein kinase regulating ubiquinone biosynthesis (AarF/ABC1/UbiB family)